VRFPILLDGQPPGATHGADADEQGHGMVTGQGLYQLIPPPRHHRRHLRDHLPRSGHLVTRSPSA